MRSVTIAFAVTLLAAPGCNKDSKDEPASAEEAAKGGGESVSREPPGRTGKVSTLAAEVLPSNVEWLAGANIEPVFDTALYYQFKPWVDWGTQRPEYIAFAAATGFEPKQLESVVAGGTFLPPAGVGVARGSFDAGKLLAMARKTIPVELVQKSVGGSSYYESEDGRAALGVEGDGTIAVGTPEFLRGSMEAQSEGGSEHDEHLVTMQKQIDTSATFWFVGAIPKALIAEAQREIRRARMPLMVGLKELSGMTHAGVSVDLSRSITVQLAVELASEEDATVAAKQLDLALKGLAFVSRPFLRDLKPVADGTSVRLTAHLDQDIWEQVVFWAAAAAQGAMFAKDKQDHRWEEEFRRGQLEVKEEKAPAEVFVP